MRSIIRVIGAVQGVGYRPFILRKATEYGIKGYVKNLGASVEILAIGEDADVLSFVEVLKTDAPVGAIVLDVRVDEITDASDIDPSFRENSPESEDFSIINSSKIQLNDLPIFLPDIGICDDCMSEMLDPSDRRYHYPLISCASCGPRISILNKLPYDRDTTTMDKFKMCPKCDVEYRNGRRTHAQTISCHDCGPQMILDFYSDITDHTDDESKSKADLQHIEFDDAVTTAAELLRNDNVIGLKGISGYQLVGKPVGTVALKLRQLKGREKKPFAVMFSDICSIKEYCHVSEKEEELLRSLARPIVLLEKKKDFDYEVCKDSRYIGAFLPSSGIHRLLTDAVGPLIVTSANISDEPIITGDEEFKEKFLLPDKVMGMLWHTRKINIPQDDSVLAVTKLESSADIKYRVGYIRRSRGYAPLPILLDSKYNGSSKSASVLAFGGDLKNTFAFGKNDRIIPSPYIGDLMDFDTLQNEKKLINAFSEKYSFKPDILVCDMHPLYQSTAIATDMSKRQNLPLLQVQHHHAHILSVMAENSLKKCIGVAFDGTGYGTDGKIWGGEILYCSDSSFERKGHLQYVKLCGGDNAPKNAKQVRECYEYALKGQAPALVKAALDNNIGTFETSSVGRLYDAIASLLDIKHENSFEGECATLLEAKAWEYLTEADNEDILPKLNIDIDFCDGQYIINQIKLFNDIETLKTMREYSEGAIAASFHLALSDCICKVCDLIRQETNEENVALSGGVFNNRLLLGKTIDELSKNGFKVYTNELVPAGDAGISLGQAYFALMKSASLN